MKKRYLIIGLIIIFVSCAEDENNTPTKPIDDTFDPTGATLIKEGMLMGSGGYTVMGTATIYLKDGVNVLVLDPFSSSNGPDLRVYLSRDVSASSFLNLGMLKSIMGKQTYVIPGNPDFTEFTHVHVYCQQFSVSFGKAEIH